MYSPVARSIFHKMPSLPTVNSSGVPLDIRQNPFETDFHIDGLSGHMLEMPDQFSGPGSDSQRRVGVEGIVSTDMPRLAAAQGFGWEVPKYTRSSSGS